MVKAILLMGPTATGKTELALRLAQYYPIEIISVDSALVYKDMNIGSAKPNSIELATVPHHLIDIINPLQVYCVANFIQDSVRLIKHITQSGKIPVLVGGAMMYYNGLLNGLSVLPVANLNIRSKLEVRGETYGWEQLHMELSQVDPVIASRIKQNDKQRIIRALEVFKLTNKPISQLQEQNKVQLAKDVQFLPLAILPNRRDILHVRIEQRFKKMLDLGFIHEVETLQQKYPSLTVEHTSMRCVGYYQAWQYLDKKISYAEMLESGISSTRQLAKRQITWLRKMELINLDVDENLDVDKIFQKLLVQIDKTL